MRSLNISPAGEGQGQGGGGPEDDSRFAERTLRSHGILSLAFGFAVGITLLIFSLVFKEKSATIPHGLENLKDVALWIPFVAGFVGGTLIAAIYNFLLFRKFNLFGTERNVD